MPLTPEQIAKIRAKEAATPDALKRDPLSDYTEGWFHVTLNARGDAPVLGYITGNAETADGTSEAPRCVLTKLGRKVEEEWRGIGRYYPECICEKVKAMPDHIHALLHLLPANKAHLGRIINGLMIGCTHAYWDTLGIPWREMRPVKDEHGHPVLDADGQPEMEEIPDITREMCMVMNELVRLIAKREDGWWKSV